MALPIALLISTALFASCSLPPAPSPPWTMPLFLTLQHKQPATTLCCPLFTLAPVLRMQQWKLLLQKVPPLMEPTHVRLLALERLLPERNNTPVLGRFRALTHAS